MPKSKYILSVTGGNHKKIFATDKHTHQTRVVRPALEKQFLAKFAKEGEYAALSFLHKQLNDRGVFELERISTDREFVTDEELDDFFK